MDTNERKILEDAGVLYPTVVTNADRIRSMSDEELANYLFNSAIYHAATTSPIPSFAEWLAWLNQDANNA